MITIVDYFAGNLGSVQNALKALSIPFQISSDAGEISRASKIIFPGVGRAGATMRVLNDLELVAVIQNCRVPFLGVCMGMQVLYEYLEEDEVKGLGVIAGTVRKFDAVKVGKIPQIGWNSVNFSPDEPLFQAIDIGSYFYFVNSYRADYDSAVTIGSSNYGGEFSAAVKFKNFYGVQFHPEKSGEAGLQLLSNFYSLC